MDLSIEIVKSEVLSQISMCKSQIRALLINLDDASKNQQDLEVFIIRLRREENLLFSLKMFQKWLSQS